ncbi:MAG TPA: hypothetical protein ENN13_00355 [Candidatus Altiarchaeales archaeon]|nr:hypothetical protein [Candidatus Altiarchaeales archaeon]
MARYQRSAGSRQMHEDVEDPMPRIRNAVPAWAAYKKVKHSISELPQDKWMEFKRMAESKGASSKDDVFLKSIESVEKVLRKKEAGNKNDEVNIVGFVDEVTKDEKMLRFLKVSMTSVKKEIKKRKQ